MVALITFLGGVRATVFAGLSVAALLWGGWQWTGKTAAKNALMEERLAQIKEDAATIEQMAALYENKVQAVNTVTKQAEVERNAQKAEYERTIADLRSRNIVVRDRFSCPARPSEESSDSGAPVGTPEGGLRGEDVEFLLSEAKRADELVTDYNELLEIVKRITQND